MNAYCCSFQLLKKVNLSKWCMPVISAQVETADSEEFKVIPNYIVR